MRQIFCALLGMLLIACNAGDKTNSSSGASGDNTISFKANGEAVNTKGLTISRVQLMPGRPAYLNITSDMHNDKRTVNVNLNGTVPGTYTLSKEVMNGSSHGLYFPDYNDGANSYSFYSGSFVITEIDTVKNLVNGSFSGEAKNEAGENVKITDGKIINGTLTPGISSVQ